MMALCFFKPLCKFLSQKMALMDAMATTLAPNQFNPNTPFFYLQFTKIVTLISSK